MSFKRLKDELKDAFSLNKQEVLDKFIEQKMYKLLSDSTFSPFLCNAERFIQPYVNELNHLWLVYLSGFDLSNIPLTKKETKIIENANKLIKTKFKNDFETFKMLKSVDIESILIYGLIKDTETVKKYLEFYRNVKLSISGEDLIEIGFKPSKKISEVLEAVMQYKYKNPEINHAEELDIAKKFM